MNPPPTLEDARHVARLLEQRQGPYIVFLNPRTVRIKGLRYLGHGSFRQVWRYGDYVLKLPHRLQGQYDNIEELDYYERLPEEHQRLLAKSYCMEGRVLVSEYVHFHRYHERSKVLDEVMTMLEKRLGLTDLHQNNFGYRVPCRTPVVVDYAL